MEESVVLVSLCCFFAHICSRPSLLLSADRVPRQTEIRGSITPSDFLYITITHQTHDGEQPAQAAVRLRERHA